MEVWELVAREQVRDVIACYGWAGDRGLVDDMMALFAPGAVLAVDGVEHTGHEAIRAVFTGAVGPTPGLLRHFTTNVLVESLSSSAAGARSYFQVLTGDGLDHWGRYRDAFVRDGDRWLFARRDVRVDGFVADGWAATRMPSVHDAP